MEKLNHDGAQKRAENRAEARDQFYSEVAKCQKLVEDQPELMSKADLATEVLNLKEERDQRLAEIQVEAKYASGSGPVVQSRNAADDDEAAAPAVGFTTDDVEQADCDDDLQANRGWLVAGGWCLGSQPE